MRSPLFVTIAVLALAGCGGSKSSKGGKSGAAQAAADCSEIPIPEDPLLAGVAAEARDAIHKGADKGLVVVQYVAEGCSVRLRVLDGCKAAGAYTYRNTGKRERRMIEQERALLEELPLAGDSIGSSLEKKGALRLDQLRVGRLEVPRKKVGAELAGRGCEGATHVAVAIDVGGFALTAGASKELDREQGFFEKDAANGVEVLEKTGDPKACAAAAKKGERTAGCDLPLRLSLMPVASTPPSQGRVVEPDKDPPPRGRVKHEVEDEGGMIAIAAGEFSMGNDVEKNESPRHKVQIDDFAIDRFEVTAASYDRCVASGACTPAKKGGGCTSGAPEKASHPINCVSWAQAAKYCEQAKLRLPTEAEWERAARGTDGRPFVWGNDWPPPQNIANMADHAAQKAYPFWAVIANYDDGYAATSPVGAFESGKSPSGAHDLAGNVMEWVADWYSDKTYVKGLMKNPKGPASGEARVVRGSSFGHHRPLHISVTARGGYRPDVQSEHVGFRCAK